MSTLVLFLAATAISLLAVLYLRAIDPKRRRLYGARVRHDLPKSRPIGWFMVLLPGLALAASSELSALLCWFGTISVLPWLISARVPDVATEARPLDH